MRRVLLALTICAACAWTSDAKPATARVAAAQVGLWRLHLYAGAIDGIDGPLTHRATVALQRSARIPIDGVIGPRTRHVLGRYGRPALGRRILRLGMVGWDVSELQFLLRRRRYRLAAITGRFGLQTRALVRAFQRASMLQPDGLAGRLTLRALLEPHGRRVRQWPGVEVRRQIDFWARRYGVDVHLARALAWMESGYRTNVTSSSGAWGIFQVEPTTWMYVETSLLGHQVARNPTGNIRVGVLYLRHLLRRFGNERRAVAAWYEGPTPVSRHKISSDTKIFVENVLALEDRM
jgi:hypothetical protein